MGDMADSMNGSWPTATSPKTQELRAELARRAKLAKIGIRTAPAEDDVPYDVGSWH